MPWLINAAQLDKFRKNQKNVVILDASWHLSTERNAKEEYLKEHVSSARFLDLNLFHDSNAGLPNMLSRDAAFVSKHVAALGITKEHKIFLYDNSKLHSSFRAYWMFKIFGHDPNLLYILDGGFDAWKKYGGKIETGAGSNVSSLSYEVNFQAQYLRTLMQMKANLHHPKEQIIDLRHPVRFMGGRELRQGLRSGHIPESFSFPYFTMFATDGKLKSVEQIRKQLSNIGIDLSRPIVTTCGSGISSAILNFALDLMNHNQHALYDGSWSEWGAEKLYAGEKSLEERPIKTSLE